MTWPFDAETWATINNWAIIIGVPIAIVLFTGYVILLHRDKR